MGVSFFWLLEESELEECVSLEVLLSNDMLPKPSSGILRGHLGLLIFGDGTLPFVGFPQCVGDAWKITYETWEPIRLILGAWILIAVVVVVEFVAHETPGRLWHASSSLWLCYNFLYYI